MTQNNWDYSAITPEINLLTKKMTDNSIIDPSLYSKYNVKRGLRDLDGKGVLTGLTDISTIIQNKEELVFAVVMTVISELFHQSFLPVALLVVPAILSVYLTRISNPKENRRIRLSLSSVGKGRI